MATKGPAHLGDGAAHGPRHEGVERMRDGAGAPARVGDWTWDSNRPLRRQRSRRGTRRYWLAPTSAGCTCAPTITRCELLDGRTFPAVDDLDENLEDFANHGVLFELAEDPGDPRITAWGALRAESEGTGGIRKVSDVPARSILSRLSDHYMQIVANRAPVGFEAEFVNTSDAYTLYRGT